jgi:hypothetical protein
MRTIHISHPIPSPPPSLPSHVLYPLQIDSIPFPRLPFPFRPKVHNQANPSTQTRPRLASLLHVSRQPGQRPDLAVRAYPPCMSVEASAMSLKLIRGQDIEVHCLWWQVIWTWTWTSLLGKC